LIADQRINKKASTKKSTNQAFNLPTRGLGLKKEV